MKNNCLSYDYNGIFIIAEENLLSYLGESDYITFDFDNMKKSFWLIWGRLCNSKIFNLIKNILNQYIVEKNASNVVLVIKNINYFLDSDEERAIKFYNNLLELFLNNDYRDVTLKIILVEPNKDL